MFLAPLAQDKVEQKFHQSGAGGQGRADNSGDQAQDAEETNDQSDSGNSVCRGATYCCSTYSLLTFVYILSFDI